MKAVRPSGFAMSRTARIPDAWTRARNRFVEDLSENEKHLFFQATPETVLYEASALNKRHESSSKSRHFAERIQGFVASVEQYGKALDVFVNTYPLVMSPLWGSFRIVLIVSALDGLICLQGSPGFDS